MRIAPRSTAMRPWCRNLGHLDADGAQIYEGTSPVAGRSVVRGPLHYRPGREHGHLQRGDRREPSGQGRRRHRRGRRGGRHSPRGPVASARHLAAPCDREQRCRPPSSKALPASGSPTTRCPAGKWNQDRLPIRRRHGGTPEARCCMTMVAADFSRLAAAVNVARLGALRRASRHRPRVAGRARMTAKILPHNRFPSKTMTRSVSRDINRPNTPQTDAKHQASRRAQRLPSAPRSPRDQERLCKTTDLISSSKARPATYGM